VRRGRRVRRGCPGPTGRPVRRGRPAGDTSNPGRTDSGAAPGARWRPDRFARRQGQDAQPSHGPDNPSLHRDRHVLQGPARCAEARAVSRWPCRSPAPAGIRGRGCGRRGRIPRRCAGVLPGNRIPAGRRRLAGHRGGYRLARSRPGRPGPGRCRAARQGSATIGAGPGHCLPGFPGHRYRARDETTMRAASPRPRRARQARCPGRARRSRGRARGRRAARRS